MTTPYEKNFHIPSSAVDRFDRMKPSFILDLMQEVAGAHSILLGAGREDLQKKGLFWAVIRHRVQITRLPASGEDITVKTWPMPTTRTAYPRATVICDSDGRELVSAVSLWVLMNVGDRAMILPGRSGVTVEGITLGCEIAAPCSIVPKTYEASMDRTVRFSELDVNGHMNNCKYLDWVADTLPGDFHKDHTPKEFTLCYLSEAREGEQIQVSWELDEEGCLTVETGRKTGAVSSGHARVFSARMQF